MLDDYDDDTPDSPVADGSEEDQAIVREAHKRFLKCEKWEAIARGGGVEDEMFANGDSENNYQWPEQLYVARTANERPVLTFSKVRQHNLQIIIFFLQAEDGIRDRPIGDGA